VQDGAAWLGSEDADAVQIEWTVLKAAPDARSEAYGVR